MDTPSGIWIGVGILVAAAGTVIAFVVRRRKKGEPQLFPFLGDTVSVADTLLIALKQSGAGRDYIKIPRGHYRQVFGVPRLLWPDRKAHHVKYEYEVRNEFRDRFEQYLAALKQMNWIHTKVVGIEGEFDPEGMCFSSGARLGLVRIQSREKDELTTQADFAVKFYYGDEFYSADGKLIVRFEENYAPFVLPQRPRI